MSDDFRTDRLTKGGADYLHLVRAADTRRRAQRLQKQLALVRPPRHRPICSEITGLKAMLTGWYKEAVKKKST